MKVKGLEVETVTALNQAMNGKTLDELKAMARFIWDRVDEENKKKDWELARQFRRGDRVVWDKGLDTYKGKVKAVNERTLSVIEETTGRKWRISFEFARQIV